MADGFKSFDDLYKAVIGSEPPGQKGPSGNKNKSRPSVVDKDEKNNKGAKKKQRSAKNNKKNHRQAPKSRRAIETEAEKRRRIQLEREEKDRKAEEYQAEKRRELLGSLKPLTTYVRCPVHGTKLQTGCRVSFSKDNTDRTLYFCKNCNKFYFISGKPKSDRKVFMYGIEVRQIKQNENSGTLAGKTIEQVFDETCSAKGMKVLKTGEPSVTRCLSCGRDLGDLNEKDALVVKFNDKSTRNIAGAYCKACAAISISKDRITSLTRYCQLNRITITSVSTRHDMRIPDERSKEAEQKFNPATTTLYIHKGKVKCLQEHHNVISVTLRVHSSIGKPSIVINANYCFDCDKFFISSEEYDYYRSIYPIMLVRFEYTSDYDSYYDNRLADKSPLMLAGYSVRADLKYSAFKRQNILRNVIELGILKKHEVINYLNYFISMNGRAKGMASAVEKWEADLAFVRSHKFELQNRASVDNVRRWGK